MAYQSAKFSHISQDFFAKYHNHSYSNTTTNLTFSRCNGQNEMTQFEEVMNTLYVVLTGIFSALSMIGTVVIIVTYIYYPEIRSKGRHFLVFLSVADFLTAFGNLFGVIWTTNPNSFSDAYCKAGPAITAFSSVSSNLWNVCMAVYLYLSLVKGYQHSVRKLKVASHALCWMIPGEYRLHYFKLYYSAKVITKMPRPLYYGQGRIQDLISGGPRS